MSDVASGTEDVLVAAALALVEAKNCLERVKVRQSAPSEIQKAEAKIVAARARFNAAALAHVESPE